MEAKSSGDIVRDWMRQFLFFGEEEVWGNGEVGLMGGSRSGLYISKKLYEIIL